MRKIIRKLDAESIAIVTLTLASFIFALYGLEYALSVVIDQ